MTDSECECFMPTASLEIEGNRMKYFIYADCFIGYYSLSTKYARDWGMRCMKSLKANNSFEMKSIHISQGMPILS